MATRIMDGYSDSDVAYAAAQMAQAGQMTQAGISPAVELLEAYGEETGDMWHSCFLFRLADGQCGVAQGEEALDRKTKGLTSDGAAVNWTVMVHHDLAFLKSEYLVRDAKPWTKANVSGLKAAAQEVKQDDVKALAVLMAESDSAVTVAQVDTALATVAADRAAKEVAEDGEKASADAEIKLP